MTTQDLDATERPAKALFSKALIGQGHDPFAEGLGDVDGSMPRSEDSQARLGVFGDDPLVPAPNVVEDRASNEAHRAGENDRVPTSAADHSHLEEIGEAHITRAVERRCFPGA